MSIQYFLEFLLCVSDLNSVTHYVFHFIDETDSPGLTFIDTIFVNFGWEITVTLSMY